MTPQSATGALEILVTAASLTTSYEEGLAAVTSGVIWLAVAGLLLSAVRKTPPKQRKRSLFTALTGLLVCGVALGTGLFWLLLLG